MSEGAEHPLERRARLLGDALSARTSVLARALQGEGGRPLFTRHLTGREALRWWHAHRADEHGQAALARLTPAERLELEVALSRDIDPGLAGESEE